MTQILNLQRNVCNHLKLIYDSSSEKRSIEPLYKLYNKDNVAFLAEIEDKLHLLVKTTTCKPSRIRCLKALVRLAYKSESILDFIIKFVNEIHGEQPDVYHIYACIIAGLIYAYENENEGVTVKLTDEQFINLFTLLTISSGDPNSATRIEAYTALGFIQDHPIPAHLEDQIPKTAKEILSDALGAHGQIDSDAECRKEALRVLNLSSSKAFNKYLTLIIRLASSDVDLEVRKIAARKLVSEESSIQNVEGKNREERINLLHRLMSDPENSDSDEIVTNLLLKWLKAAINDEADEGRLYAATRILIGDLLPQKYEKFCEKVLVLLFDKLSSRKHGGLAEFVKSLSLACQDPDNDHEVLCLSRSNYKDVLLDARFSMFDKASFLFHWRVLIQYCHENYEKNDGLLSQCVYRLMPTLAEMITLGLQFSNLTSVTNSSFSEDGSGSRSPSKSPSRVARTQTANRGICLPNNNKIKHERERVIIEQADFSFCVIQYLRILYFYEIDPYGVEKWREFSLLLLQNNAITVLQKDLLTEIMESFLCSSVKFANCVDNCQFCKDCKLCTEHAANFLTDFCDALNNMYADVLCLPDSDEAQEIIESPPSSPLRPPNIQANQDQRICCLATFTEFLKTDQFETLSPQIQGLYDSLVSGGQNHSYGIFATDPAERIYAFECVGWMAFNFEDRLIASVSLLYGLLQAEKTGNESESGAKPTCLNILSDLVIRYGHEKVAQAYATAAGVKNEPEPGELEHTPDQELDLTAFAHRPSGIIQLSSLLMRDFMEYAEHKNEETVAVAVENLCRWLFYPHLFKEEAQDDEQSNVVAWSRRFKILSRLLLFAFRENSRSTPQNACIYKFLPCFASISRENQRLLIEALFESMDFLKTTGMKGMDYQMLIRSVLQLTSVSVSESAKDIGGATEEQPHDLFARRVLQHPEDYYAETYYSMLNSLDLVQNINVAKELMRYCENDLDEEAEAANTRAKLTGKLNKFRSRLKKLISAHEETKSTSEDDHADIEEAERQLMLETPAALLQRNKPIPNRSVKKQKVKKSGSVHIVAAELLQHSTKKTAAKGNQARLFPFLDTIPAPRSVRPRREAKTNHRYIEQQLNFTNISEEILQNSFDQSDNEISISTEGTLEVVSSDEADDDGIEYLNEQNNATVDNDNQKTATKKKQTKAKTKGTNVNRMRRKSKILSGSVKKGTTTRQILPRKSRNSSSTQLTPTDVLSLSKPRGRPRKRTSATAELSPLTSSPPRRRGRPQKHADPNNDTPGPSSAIRSQFRTMALRPTRNRK